MIFKKFANLKYKYRNSHFWYRGFYVDTVGSNKTTVEEYIKNQQKRYDLRLNKYKKIYELF